MHNVDFLLNNMECSPVRKSVPEGPMTQIILPLWIFVLISFRDVALEYSFC